jgi:hypothetical protein
MIVAPQHTANREANGNVVLRDSSGRAIDTFPRSAIIDVEKGQAFHAVEPGQRLPRKYENVTPLEVIR